MKEADEGEGVEGGNVEAAIFVSVAEADRHLPDTT